MSGGVDSSVAAHLLLAAGHEVTGLFMKNWEEDDEEEGCSAATDLADCEAVAERLGIALRTVNFATEYWDRVFCHFLSEYQAGRTPNPDVLCNREIKFKEFRDHARRLGATQIATGHYARVTHGASGTQLRKALDLTKDQSYFLHSLGQDALEGVIFPLGELRKDDVRDIARRQELGVHAKRDSTGICFIGERPFAQFLAKYLKTEPGPLVDPEGLTVGEHRGASLYTIGQRQGLGIGGSRHSTSTDPWYVYAKDMNSNTVNVVQGHDHCLLQCTEVDATNVSWIAGHPPGTTFEATAKTRYRQTDVPCHVEVQQAGEIRVTFPTQQRAVTPGQSVVLYNGDICLGGGVINESRHAHDFATPLGHDT
jgi:tRNA-uridine 2-sulfurtransferase